MCRGATVTTFAMPVARSWFNSARLAREDEDEDEVEWRERGDGAPTRLSRMPEPDSAASAAIRYTRYTHRDRGNTLNDTSHLD